MAILSPESCSFIILSDKLGSVFARDNNEEKLRR